MLTLQKSECLRESRPARILHLEDKELDRELVKETIQSAGIDCEVTAIETREDFVSQVLEGVLAWKLGSSRC